MALASGVGGPVAEPFDEHALVQRARAGDTAAFRALVERHRVRAVALALRVLRVAADAEEVAQDAFVRAWAALPAFRADASFGTWLHRIVWYRALDFRESRNARVKREEKALAWHEPHGAGSSGGDGDERVVRLVEALPRAQREVVTLFYFEDRSVDEVARVLGMPAGTVKTHLHRARAALRDAWTNIEEAPE